MMPETSDFEPLWLTSVGSCLVRGQRAFGIAGVPRLDPRELLQAVIVLDGQRVRVVGVETPALADPTGLAFSLLVTPDTAA